jgi:hypothetical protein
MRPPQTFSAALNTLVKTISSRSAVAKLRADAARVDAEFQRQEARAESNLAAIRQRNAIDASNRILARTTPASSPCLPCVADPFKGGL